MGWEAWGVLGTWAAVIAALVISIMGNLLANKREQKARDAQDRRDSDNHQESLEVRMAEQRRYLTSLVFDHLREIREAYDSAIISIKNNQNQHAEFAENAKLEAEDSVYDLLDSVMNARTVEGLDRALRNISESAAQNWSVDLLKQTILDKADDAHRRARGNFAE